MPVRKRRNFTPLLRFLKRVPAIEILSSGVFENGNWWVKLTIDIDHRLAWRVVQELGYVLNYVSIEERLPTVFMPVSPPPYMNGGPETFLSWVIESMSPSFSPKLASEWLRGRLPRPVDDLSKWRMRD